MNQIVMPPKMAASPNRSIVESRNAPNLPELPLILASWPSSMSVKTKHVAMKAPGNSSPIGSSQSEAAETPTVPATVIMFGVTGVRASPWTIGLNRRAKTGRRKFSMAGQDLTWVLFPLAALASRLLLTFRVVAPSLSPAGDLIDSRSGVLW